jgi:hypothetical protein
VQYMVDQRSEMVTSQGGYQFETLNLLVSFSIGSE